MAKPERILVFVKVVNHENLRICLDTVHEAVFPDLTLSEEVRRLSDFIRVLHIHDNQGEKDDHLYPTRGIILWPDFIEALKETGFIGVLSLGTMPAGDLADDCFERESRELCQITKGFIHKTK